MSIGLTYCAGCGEMMIEHGVCSTCTMRAAAACPYPARAERQARRDAENGAVLINILAAGVAVVMAVFVVLALSGGNLATDADREHRAEVASRAQGLLIEGLWIGGKP